MTRVPLLPTTGLLPAAAPVPGAALVPAAVPIPAAAPVLGAAPIVGQRRRPRRHSHPRRRQSSDSADDPGGTRIQDDASRRTAPAAQVALVALVSGNGASYRGAAATQVAR